MQHQALCSGGVVHCAHLPCPGRLARLGPQTWIARGELPQKVLLARGLSAQCVLLRRSPCESVLIIHQGIQIVHTPREATKRQRQQDRGKQAKHKLRPTQQEHSQPQQSTTCTTSAKLRHRPSCNQTKRILRNQNIQRPDVKHWNCCRNCCPCQRAYRELVWRAQMNKRVTRERQRQVRTYTRFAFSVKHGRESCSPQNTTICVVFPVNSSDSAHSRVTDSRLQVMRFLRILWIG